MTPLDEMGAAGILYAEDFDEPEAGLALPMRHFTMAERDEAVAGACASAVSQAQLAWAQSDQQRRTMALSQIADGLHRLQADAAAQQAALALETAKTMLSVLATMLPTLSARHGAAEVEAVLRTVLPRLSQQAQITLRVAPGTAEHVRPALMLLEQPLANALTLAPDARLEPGDIRLAWPNGTFVRSTAAITAAVLEAIQAAIPTAAAAPADQPAPAVHVHPRRVTAGPVPALT